MYNKIMQQKSGEIKRKAFEAKFWRQSVICMFVRVNCRIAHCLVTLYIITALHLSSSPIPLLFLTCTSRILCQTHKSSIIKLSEIPMSLFLASFLCSFLSSPSTFSLSAALSSAFIFSLHHLAPRLNLRLQLPEPHFINLPKSLPRLFWFIDIWFVAIVLFFQNISWIS